MSTPSTSILLLGNHVFMTLTLCVSTLTTNALGAPAPKPKIYALLYVPKKSDRFETARNRRKQIAEVKSQFTFYTAIHLLKDVDLPSLPNKGQPDGDRDSHEVDVDWMQRNLKIEYLDDTGVIRIGLIAGSPLEQALLVNAVARAYLKDIVRRDREDFEMRLEALKRDLDRDKQVLPAKIKPEIKANIEREIELIKDAIKRTELELRTLPQLLELAEVPKD
jgi:hypothetical protein